MASVSFVIALSAPAAFAQNSLRLAWDANTETNLAGYRVTYVPQSGGTTRTLDVGNATSATVGGLDLGRWYNFSVAAYNTSGGVSTPSTVVSAFTTSLATLTASTTGTVAPGTTVTWTATPAAGSPALEYQFWMLSNGSWQVVRPWAAQGSYSWTPAMADVGQHALQVWARQPGATSNYEAYLGTGYFDVAAKPFTVTALLANGTSPFATGEAIQWTAVINPADVTDALEYQFWLLNKATGVWTSVRPYAQGNTFTFTPTWDQVGSYAIQVWARYRGTTVRYAGWFGVDFRVDRGVGTLSSDKVLPVPPGTPITWTADAGASASPLQYQFWLLSGGGWRMVQDYSTTKTFSWTPSAADLGQHALQVWVKNANSTGRYDAWRGTGYFDVASTAPSVIAINFSAPPQTGTPTTINAIASGGYAGPLQYRFWIFSHATSSWTILQDYSSSSTASWTPAAAGDYSIQVWVRSVGSSANYEAWQGLGPVVVP